MANINNYPTANPLQIGDQIVVWSNSNSDTRKSTIAALTELIQEGLDIGKQAFTPQYAAPTATGFDVQITDSDDNIWLVLTPDAGYAAGTITLPSVVNVADKQEILVNCTQVVTTLTIAPNGATVVGQPTTLAANDSFKLKFDLTLKRWYKVA